MAADNVLSRAGSPLGASEQAPRLLRDACWLTGSRILAAVVIAGVMNALAPFAFAARFFWHQDLVCLLTLSALLMWFGRFPVPAAADDLSPWLTERPGRSTLLLVVFAAAVIGGTYALTGGFHLSRDEAMADFDAVIFRSGRLLAPIPPEWRTFRDALIPNFLLPVPAGLGFASNYLPGNAALRALVGLVVSADWTSPLLAGIAILALFRIGRRLWPNQPEPVVVAVLMLATASQVLVTATTSYAMTAHLAVNLVWLWLFLRDDRIGHAGAIAVGVLGCGLHQIIFHPVFAAPFILRLCTQRRWRLAFVYGVAYCAIGLFWMSYPGIAAASLGATATGAPQAASHFVVVVIDLIGRFSLLESFLLTLDNLLRLASWQHLLLLPLVLASLPLVRRGEGIARPLLIGALLTVLVPFAVLPLQGYGWGYRYLHGCLGSLSLLAGYGWVAVTRGIGSGQRRIAYAVLAISTGVTVVVELPVHLLQVQAMEAPSRAALADIRQAPTDLVFVDPSGMRFARDLVRNDPFLRNRPKVLDLERLDLAGIRQLCARYTVATFDLRQGDVLGFPHLPADLFRPRPGLLRRRALMRSLGCGSEQVATPGVAQAPRIK